MAADAVELLQREIRFSSGKRIYSLLYGYQYFTDRRFALKMRYTNNHFLTLVEPFDAHSETIVSYRHTKAIRQQPTVYLATDKGKCLPDLHVPGLRQWFCTLCVVPARFLVTAVLRLRRKWALRRAALP